MKHIALLVLAAAAATPAHSGPEVGVSIGIQQPGVYGRIDIGNVAPPPVVVAQPVVVAAAPVAVYQRPIYLYVPVVVQRNWPRYCNRYAACGQPVYFVQETWVRERWARERHDDDDDDDRRGRRKHRHKHDRDDD